MARVVLSSKYAVLYRNYRVQGVRFKTRRCALLTFAPHNTTVTFSSLSSDLVSENLGGGLSIISARAVSCKVFRWPEEVVSPGRTELCQPGLSAVLCQQKRPLPLGTQALTHVLCCKLSYNVTGRKQKQSPASEGLGVSAQ